MGLTKRRDSYYVEFPVLDDGKTLTLARGVSGAKLRRWKVGSLNKTVAKQQEALLKTELMKGLIKSDQAQVLTFKDWGETYLSLEEVTRLRSYRDRKKIVNQQLIPFFGKTLLADITPEHIQAYRAQRRRRNGRAVKLQTINNDHIILKHCLNVARRHKKLLMVNPATLVPIPNANNERDRVLSPEEWRMLYEAAAPHLKPVMLMAYQMGQRLGEIVNLTWDRVDLQRGFVTLRAIDTKTKKPRQVPITPAVRAALADLSKVRNIAHKQVFVYKGRPVKEIRTAFKTAKTNAGIQDLRFHDLRHCAATNLRRAGVDTTTAMKIIGHKSAHMWERYNTVDEGDLLAAASRLNSYLSNTVITPEEVETQAGSTTA